MEHLIDIFIVFTVAIILLIISLLYWFILGHKSKHKEKIFLFLDQRLSSINYSLLFCVIVYMVTYVIVTWDTMSESCSFTFDHVQLAAAICLFPLIIPVTLYRCLKIDQRKKNNK